MSAPPLVEMHRVCCYRGDTRVFDDLSLTIARGEAVAVLGPNGSGKTTLLKLLTRDLYPVVREDSWLRIEGSERVYLDDLRRRVAVISQDLQERYPPWATAEEVVLSGLFGSLGLYPHHPVSPAARERAQALLAAEGLGALADSQFQHLSTGQQRRLLLLRARMAEPHTYVLDEPTNSLDLAASFALLATLRRLVREGAGLLLATHHLDEIIPEIRRVILLQQGRVVGDGPKEEMLTAERLSALYGTPLALVEQGGYYRAVPV